ncbi:ribonuclease H-like domain-containing protein [Tanacetum coccineum]
MNSPSNYEWEQLLDIDDFDLPLTPVLRPCNSHVRETTTTTTTQNLVIGGDESVLSTQEYIRKVIDDVGEDKDFRSGSWVNAVEFVNVNGGGIVNGCLEDIENYLKNGKLEQFVAIIKSCTPNALGDLTVTLKDLSVFSPKPSMHYLNITMRNVVKVFHKDIIPSNVSGVGENEMLDEEEIMKLEEEEMVDLELQVCGNVIDREDQYKLDEEALNLALEEEAIAARAEQEWLEKCWKE